MQFRSAGFNADRKTKQILHDSRKQTSNTKPYTAQELVNQSDKWASQVKQKQESCMFCDSNHISRDCLTAKDLSIEERRDILKNNGCCFRCLLRGHVFSRCFAKIKCAHCKSQKHSTAMCNRSLVPSPTDTEPKQEGPVNTLTNNSHHPEVLLQTILLRIRDSQNKEHLIRTLIDSASMQSYISVYAAEKLGLQAIDQESVIHGLFGGLQLNETHNRYRVTLGSFDRRYSCKVELLDKNKICADIPELTDKKVINELKRKKIFLSDNFSNTKARLFQNSPQEIHLLLGANILAKLITKDFLKLPNTELVAIRFKVGWAVMGNKNTDTLWERNSLSTLSISMLVADAKFADLWNLDALGIKSDERDRNKQELEADALEYFTQTVRRDTDNRYEISLPWVLPNSVLHHNFELAETSLHRTTNKLEKLGRTEEYSKVFELWESDGIIETVNDVNLSGTHYLPHRPVFKDSSSTRVRPVFNASSRVKTSPSLNDCLATGPNLLEIVPSVLNKFRKFRIAVSSDIEKAFLQIKVREKDCEFLRFLWHDKGKKLKVFRHRRLAFGLTSSPFILLATINHHLDQVCDDLFETAQQLKESFYVDNCLTSLSSANETEKFVTESREIMSAGHFNLRCWRSNLPTANSDELDIHSTVVPILGLLWNIEDDTLSLKLDFNFPENERVTKRKVLSVAQKVYDPVGYTIPVMLVVKILLQETWTLKLKWDEEVPSSLDKRFRSWAKQLPLLKQLHIPRWLNITPENESDISLHVFCDASKYSYATCAYVRTESELGITVQLVNARGRVAPLKPLTIPRLELLACLIGARLISTIIKELKLKDVSVILWTDSSTTLGWLRREEQWGTFVHNRVKEIQSLTNSHTWRHVPGTLNPADLPSRGCSAEQLLKSEWWEGPRFLYLPESEWPCTDVQPDEELLCSEKRKTVLTACNKSNSDWYYRYFSSYRKIVRMIAWIFRFYFNIKGTSKITTPVLTVEEIDQAERHVLHMIQKDSFTGIDDPSIRQLRPIIDSDGILRTQTNVIYRNDAESFKFPVLLPSNHPVVHSLIMEKHVEHQHAGVTILMAQLRENYWVLRTRRTVKNVLKKCVKCQRFSASHAETTPGIPPADRVKDASVFEVVGVDLAGPLYLKGDTKAWIVLFTCAVYRAVHLELVSSLSTEAFILCLRRFIARRGKPYIIYSDNGTNFVGANRALQNIDWEAVLSVTTTQRIRWKFSPPSAAWWGGWWERIIRMVKQILRRVLGRACLGYEEMNTILCDCEQVINSRPITYISEDANDPTPLTPAMFLQELTSSGIPDLDVVDKKELSKRAKYRQRLRDELRKRFRSEYLGQLKHRVSREKKTTRISVGDIVLLEDTKKHRIHWPLAKIIEIFPGKDNVVRLAKVQTSSGIFTRPVQRLYPLEISSKEDADPFPGQETDPAVAESQPTEPVDAKQQKDPELTLTRYGRVVRPPERLSVTTALTDLAGVPHSNNSTCSVEVPQQVGPQGGSVLRLINQSECTTPSSTDPNKRKNFKHPARTLTLEYLPADGEEEKKKEKKRKRELKWTML